MKKVYSINLDVKNKERLDVISENKYTKVSTLLNKILGEWLDKEEGVIEEVKKEEVKRKELSPEEKKEMRDWELSMVARGDFHQGWLEEPPRCDLSPEEKAIYNTPDNQPRNGRIFEGETELPPIAPTPLADAKREELKREETQKEIEDREFDESLKMSLAEKE